MLVTKKNTKSSQLIIPRRELGKIDGNKRRRISAVITDPRSRHIILTRYPEYQLKIWYQTTIEREVDFIPTAILKKAKIHNDTSFTVKNVEGDLVVRRVPNG